LTVAAPQTYLIQSACHAEKTMLSQQKAIFFPYHFCFIPPNIYRHDSETLYTVLTSYPP